MKAITIENRANAAAHRRRAIQVRVQRERSRGVRVKPLCSAMRLSEWWSQPEIVRHELSKEHQPENQVASNQGPEPAARESPGCKPPRHPGTDQQKPRNREAEVIRIEERSTTTAESIDENAPTDVEVRVK